MILFASLELYAVHAIFCPHLKQMKDPQYAVNKEPLPASGNVQKVSKKRGNQACAPPNKASVAGTARVFRPIQKWPTDPGNMPHLIKAKYTNENDIARTTTDLQGKGQGAGALPSPGDPKSEPKLTAGFILSGFSLSSLNRGTGPSLLPSILLGFNPSDLEAGSCVSLETWVDVDSF